MKAALGTLHLLLFIPAVGWLTNALLAANQGLEPQASLFTNESVTCNSREKLKALGINGEVFPAMQECHDNPKDAICTGKKLQLSFPVVFSLKCFQCQGDSTSCRMVRKTCPAYETTCIAMAYQKSNAGGSSVDEVIKGCTSTTLCNITSVIDTGAGAMYMTSTCCETDYCNINRFSALSIASMKLQCYSCPNISSCQAPTNRLDCRGTNNQCVDIATNAYNNGTLTTNTYTKGCGSGEACNALMAYNTGSTQLYTQFQCCSKGNLCNSKIITVTKPKYNNGITCWGCNETGNNECALKNQVQVQCRGTLIRCMEMFGGPDRKTLKKGCCTEDMCSDTYPAIMGIPRETEIQCCAGSFCNKWPKAYPCPMDYSASWRLQGSKFLLLAALLSGLLRVLL